MQASLEPKFEGEVVPLPGSLEDLPSFSSATSRTSGNREEHTGPGPNRTNDLPSFSPAGSVSRTDNNELGHNETPRSTADKPEHLIALVDENNGMLDEEDPEHGVQSEDLHYSLGFSIHMNRHEDVVIAGIRATDVVLGLRRLPAGFYVVVLHSGLEWRTENKRASVDDDVVEWITFIPIPSDPSATVRIEVYASFEFQPTLGTGEQLNAFAVAAEELLRHKEEGLPFVISQKDREVTYPCSSISFTVERRNYDPSASGAFGPHYSTVESVDDPENATNQGHILLSRYQKFGGKRDLERSIELFERALGTCPSGHACRAAAQSNLAMAKFIHSQVESTDSSFDVPLSLYRDALTARPIGHLDRPSTLIQLAAVHFARFEYRKDEVEGRQAEAFLREVIELCSTDSHETQAAIFMLRSHVGHSSDTVRTQHSASSVSVKDSRTLGAQLLRRFGRLGDMADLHRAIAVLEGLVKSTPLWDTAYREGLANLGVAISYRFSRLGKLDDVEDAVLMHRKAVGLTPRDSPEKSTYLNNLGNALDTRFKRLGDPADLEDAVSTLRCAVDLTPPDHPVKSARLSNLGNSYLNRFQRFEDPNDLERALLAFSDAVDLSPRGQVHSPALLNNLGSCFFLRFERFAGLGDLDIATSRHQDAVDITPDSHPDKQQRLINLGNDFRARFKHTGELSDLEHALSTISNSVVLTPDSHPQKPGRLSLLGNCYFVRFWRLGELSDLDVAISRHKDALDLTPAGHPEWSSYLNNLGNTLQTRFKYLGELGDLENAISMLKQAVELTPHGHRHKPSLLNNFGASLFLRFEYLGVFQDLEDAVSRHRDAVDLTPHDHPLNHIHLNSLGNVLNARFQRLGELVDIDQAVSILRKAVDLTPQGHPDKPGRFNSLGSALVTRFEHVWEPGDIDSAISVLSDAIKLTSHGDPHLASRFENLGNSLNARFERFGEASDLDKAILTLKNAVDLTPHDHPDKPNRLSNLARSFRFRFMRFGELSDLEHAVSNLKDTVDLAPDNHPKRRRYLHNLANSLVTRFKRLGELGDIKDTVLALKEATYLTPDDHPDKPTILNSLGTALTALFELLLEFSSLEDGISVFSRAVILCPYGHPHKAGFLNSLGISLLTRFKHFGQLSDLEDAVSRFKDAVELTPRDHPRKPTFLDNLGKSFASRFERLRELGDLGYAIASHRDAVELTPHGHPDKASFLNSLGISLVTRYKCLLDPSDLEQAISLFSLAASAFIGPVSDRFKAAKNWISCARRMRHRSLFRAYSVAVHLLPQLAWIGLSLPHRYQEVEQGTDVVREAAAAALDLGFVQTAVEWLEQGRSIVWGELFQLRSSYEELSSAHPDHARRLRELSAALEDAGNAREKSMFVLLEQTRNAAQSSTTQTGSLELEREADRHHELAIARDTLLKEIRKLPGFERFLRHKEFSQLRASAHSGPVAILNAAENRCDALIIVANVDHVVHVPLPNFTLKRTANLQEFLKSFVRHAREGKSVPLVQDGITLEYVLSPLWKCVVKPVLDALAFSVPGELSRIFWCPTGPFTFLPIHAAGFYDPEYSSPGHKVYDFVVSSYIPSLGILTRSPNSNMASRDSLRLLAVGQPQSDGLSRLPGVAIELQHIKDVISSSRSAPITLLESSTGTVEEVLGLMKEADWVHFACHGIQDAALPTESGLCLADTRRLKVHDIIALSCPHGGLAFLSACQTAKGDIRLSDEAIHIAAGMLFAGYAGVVGTMWSISDALAPDVARDVYGYLFRRSATRPDCFEAAHALHDAVAGLREGGASFGEWIPFIHVGL